MPNIEFRSRFDILILLTPAIESIPCCCQRHSPILNQSSGPVFRSEQTAETEVRLWICTAENWWLKSSRTCVVHHATQAKLTYLCKDQDLAASMKMLGGRLWRILALIELSGIHVDTIHEGSHHNMRLQPLSVFRWAIVNLIAHSSNIGHGRPWINRVSDNHFQESTLTVGTHANYVNLVH